MLKGIDVSTVQGTIAWSKVKRAGVDFAMIKASQGRGESATTKNLTVFKDSQFVKNISSAYAAGIACGVYHYFTATTAADRHSDATTAAVAKALLRRIFLWS